MTQSKYHLPLPEGYHQTGLQDQLKKDENRKHLLKLCDRYGVSEQAFLNMLENPPPTIVDLCQDLFIEDEIILVNNQAEEIFNHLQICL